MMLSIIVCTYNRGDILRECLESVIEHYKEGYSVELIVVDNNSSDGTADLVKGLEKEHHWIRYEFEKQQGLSYARNTGYKVAKKDWVLYLDDDATIYKEFFDRLKFLIEETKYKCVGGLYVPWYKYGQPKWFKDDFASNRKSYTELSVLKDNEFASGGIFLVKKELFELNGGFDPNLGMKGKTVNYGEEDDFQRRVRETGVEIAYDPHLVICHLVPKYKMNVKWFLRSSFMMGKKFLQIKGYPQNKLMGLLALGIGLAQCVLSFILSLPKLLRKDYYKENFVIDVLKKPIKWFGAFVGTFS